MGDDGLTERIAIGLDGGGCAELTSQVMGIGNVPNPAVTTEVFSALMATVCARNLTAPQASKPC